MGATESLFRTDDDLVVYRHVGCQYCERVVRKLKEYDLKYTSRFVVPTHSDRNLIKSLVGSRSVPVLVDRNAGAILSESASIVEYVETTYGGES